MKWIPLTVLALAGLFAAGPFLTSRALGTREAYNYHLSVADAVTQFRNGTLPVLAGQTEFAFNGRIHPLRTAPYMDYLAGALDVLALRQLGFWSLQNLTLALSLIGGVVACYWALRRVTPATPGTAAALSCLYVLSPSVLAAAYGMDLYMTVMTVPFVPLIIAANLAALAGRRRADFVLLATALAACWLAHPPVALWMSLITLSLQVVALCLRPPSWRELPVLAGTVALGIILAGFGFASALTISPYQDVTRTHDISLLLTEVSRGFAASLRPVSARGDQIGDFQLGYAGWGLAGVALVLAVGRRQWTALLLLLVAAFLFTLTAPVPGLHRWLWEHAPAAAVNLTNQWPMQRLYLPITALVIFSFALVWRWPTLPTSWLRDAFRLLLVLAIGWTCWQSWRFVGRGFAGRQSPEATRRGQLSGNIDLTSISYAVLGLPGDFNNGVMDPAFGFRLLAPYDARETASNWTATLPPSAENSSGILEATAGDLPEVLDLPHRFTLRPGTRYRLAFKFLAPPGNAVLQLRGASLFREYSLPAAGGSRGFGMQPGNNARITLWTAQAMPEDIQLRLVVPGMKDSPWQGRPFAGFNFERVEPSALPVELQSLQPLRCRVTAIEAGYLETPRMFILGYEASVNGRPVRAQPSPDGLLMLPVPAGESRVELRYVGPSVVRWSFWLACVGWTGLAAWGFLNAGPAGWREAAVRPAGLLLQRGRGSLAATTRMRLIGILCAMTVFSGTIFGWKMWSADRAAIGPIRIRFVLPRGETNRQQPLLVTGRPQAGTFIYAVYLDADHIRLGVDIWGVFGYQTEPIKVDYFADHELVVDDGALYPAGHPALNDMPSGNLSYLRNHLRIELDGRTMIEREVNTHHSKTREVTVGRNNIGGSSCEPRFAGKILGVERLPLSTPSR